MAEEPSSPIPACPPLPKDLVAAATSPRKPPPTKPINRDVNNRRFPKAAPVVVTPNEDTVSLEEVLKTFNAPISEDQAWALIYQSARMFKAALLQEGEGGGDGDDSGGGGGDDGDSGSGGGSVSGGKGGKRRGRRRRPEIRLPVKTRHLNVNKDGSCSVAVGDEEKDICVTSSQKKILLKLGIVVYTALDYNLPPNEDCPMSHELEELIEFMTAEDNDDEGIEHDSEEPVTDEDEAVVADHVDEEYDEDEGADGNGGEDEDHRHHQHYHYPRLGHHHHHHHHHHCNGDDGTGRSKSHHETKELDHVLAFCSSRVSPSKPEDHYRAVCRALATETLELRTFLQRVCTGEGAEVLRLKAQAETSGKELEKIHFSDWARFWMQVVDELRRGVRLKKISCSRTPIEYELTPYEILMEDIRSRKYNLRKVMVDGDIPPRVKKDAHAVILEFIRSRPPLRKASDRKLAPQPLKRVACPREQLLDSIRKGRVLKPVHPKLKTRRVASMISIMFPMPQPFHCINIFLPTTQQIDSVKKSCDELANSSSSNSHSTTNNNQQTAAAAATSAVVASSAPTAQSSGSGRQHTGATAAKSFGAAAMYANSPRNTLRLIPVDFSLFEDDDFIIETAPNGDSTAPGSSHPRPNGGGRYATLVPGSKRSGGASTNLINNENNQNNINTVLRRTKNIITHDEYHRFCDKALETYDLATQCESRRASMRRHTIIGCNQNYKLDHLSSHSMPPSRPASRQSDHNGGGLAQQTHAQGTPQHTQLTTTSTATTSNGCAAAAAVVAGDLLVASSNMSSLDTWTKSSLDEHQWKDTFNLNDRLSLTLEEIVHIRSVMTKAELEGLPVDVHIKEDVEKRKVCFLCLRTRFTLFARGILCKLCQRTVCNKCNQKMRIPTEHFRNVPVVLLSPSLMSSPCTSNTPSPSHHHAHGGGSGPHSLVDETFPRSLMERLLRPELDRKTRNTVGSAPSSPKNQRSASSTPGSSLHGAEPLSLPMANGSGAKDHNHHPSATASATTSQHQKSLSLMTRSMEGPHSLPPQSPARPHSNNSTLDRSTSRNRFAKAFTLSAAAAAGQNSVIDPQKERLTGELMAVCNDCRSLVLEIIRSSRQTRSSAQNQALRNLTLDLSPVYKR
ncbi:protein spire isoform X3 [Culex quinquefasciatus]|uniref:protein spire isoform X3 n=1 Tax=Culex quinquefasciatus TaxID=7176 RepID=UPI0018E3D4B2|nr:protein spire isoform X3 [Culex quinquefasciatus]